MLCAYRDIFRLPWSSIISLEPTMGFFFARENKLVWLVQLFDSHIESSPREDPPILGTAEPHFIHEISKATWRQTQ